MAAIIDLFAGPGGLAEGFSSVVENGMRFFDVRLSIEKEPVPYRTLQLRSFLRQFPPGALPDDYYRFLCGELAVAELYSNWPDKFRAAQRETWQLTLGSCNNDLLDARIHEALQRDDDWVLIGGPPCQAYSTAGMVGNRTRKDYRPERDERYFLYRDYIRILGVHQPAVFVMENVRGLLFARLGDKKIVSSILEGLSAPSAFLREEFQLRIDSPEYKLFSLSHGPQSLTDDPRNYLLHAEKTGIPQARHRIFIVGFRQDIAPDDFRLPEVSTPVSFNDAVGDLPALRSRLTRIGDTSENRAAVFASVCTATWMDEVAERYGRNLCNRIIAAAKQAACSRCNSGSEFMEGVTRPTWKPEWFCDARLPGILHHSARAHMPSDLHRYLFYACFCEEFGRSPLLKELPSGLLPAHKNAKSGHFADRFRVQLPDRPASTIISHLAKDGHAFIHPDSVQCRSLTPREAARLQTFPDNYFFFGTRSQQFQQIGNAVPPLLARSVALALREFYV